MNIEAIATLSPMAGLVDDAVCGDIHDLYKLCPGKFSAPPGTGILRVAGDPEGIDMKLASDRRN
jgi:hypothetical protein